MSEVKVTAEVLDDGIKIIHEIDGCPVQGGTYHSCNTYGDLQRLEGKVLTLLDATIAEKQQNKAVKDIFRRMFWFDWVDSLYKGKNPSQAGMPNIEQ